MGHQQAGPQQPGQSGLQQFGQSGLQQYGRSPNTAPTKISYVMDYIGHKVNFKDLEEITN